MTFKALPLLAGLTLLTFGAGAALADKTIEDEGQIVCATDKWEEKEVAKDHKTVESTSRCVVMPTQDPAKVTQACAGKFEYLPDGSWKGSGTCTDTFPGGDKLFMTWEEGSHLKEYLYSKTGGTGKYEGASGGGTYKYDMLTDTLIAGWYKGKIILPDKKEAASGK